eukprot:TRINITY_DN12859_c0_g1_i1.p1 TRINITY_DN12859_c0_g1~~TRINITY_DN12859_c0_g1_i1.p1  ORF type:complete len:244 (-),score=55.02 TRINITY_DN12859_c0_g1_i1:134-865(-)
MGNGYSTVREAAANGCIKEIERHLSEQGKMAINDVEAKTGETALHAAVKAGYEETVNFFLNNNVDVNACDRLQRNALHWAAFHNYPEVTLLLAKAKGMDLNAVDKAGQTAVHIAAQYGHHDSLRHILEAGAEPSIQDRKGKTALHEAAIGEPTSTSLLLAHPATKRDIVDNQNRTALDLALAAGRSDIAALFDASVDDAQSSVMNILSLPFLPFRDFLNITHEVIYQPNEEEGLAEPQAEVDI